MSLDTFSGVSTTLILTCHLYHFLNVVKFVL